MLVSLEATTDVYENLPPPAEEDATSKAKLMELSRRFMALAMRTQRDGEGGEGNEGRDGIRNEEDDRSRIEKWFKQLDTDGSGMISVDEFYSAMRKKDVMSHAEARAMLKMKDENSDGSLDMGEV